MTDTSLDDQHSTTSDKPVCDRPVAVVLPRKKRGQPKVRGMRVSLSKEDIHKLFHLRQVEAAKLLVSPSPFPPLPALLPSSPPLPLSHRALLACSRADRRLSGYQGLSLTALKSVCRKVGVLRWPYSRDRQQPTTTGLGSSASSGWSGTGEKPEEVSDASTEDVSGGEEGGEWLLHEWDEDCEQEEERRPLDARWIAWYISATEESDVSMW